MSQQSRGFDSARRAFETPPEDAPLAPCPVCNATGEVVECPKGCDGSHRADVPWPCLACDGTTEVVGVDHPDWCNRCGLSGRCPDCDPPDRAGDF